MVSNAIRSPADLSAFASVDCEAHSAATRKFTSERKLTEKGFDEGARPPVRFFLNGFGDELGYDWVPIQEPLSGAAIATLESAVKSALPGVAFLPDGTRDPNVRILVHGIEPPLETPLAWLCANLAHADLFLYVSVVKQSSEE